MSILFLAPEAFKCLFKGSSSVIVEYSVLSGSSNKNRIWERF